MATKRVPPQPAYLKLTVRVRLEEELQQGFPEMLAYAFDRNGRFLDQEKLPAKQDSEVMLKIPPALKGESIRVLIGPPYQADPDEAPDWVLNLLKRPRDASPALSLLARKGAVEKRVLMKSDSALLNLLIFPNDWKKYLLCRCQVRGRVVKPIELPNGTTEQLSVCHALVLVYEVDKWPRLVFKLPERHLFDLRDRLRGLIDKEVLQTRIPIPEPDPFRFSQLSKLSRLPLAREVAPPPSAPVTAEAKASLDPVFSAQSGPQLRNALIEASTLIHPYLCRWPDLFSVISKDLIKVVATDEEGRFDTSIWYRCTGDKPDLYFKVLQFNGSVLHVLSDPGAACHTYWNYLSGTEVLIETHDPSARTCISPDPVDIPEGVGSWVMPFKVGNILLTQIRANGLVDYGGVREAPFGGSLGFRHGYSSDMPTDAFYYYRWSFQKEGDSGWTDFVEPFASTIVRHYVKEVPGEYPTFPVCVLGPKGVSGKHLYRFRPHDPTDCDDYSPGGSAYWPTDTWFGDIYSGLMRSGNLPGGSSLANGRYRFKLEVYNKAGSRVAPGTGSFQFIVPTGFASDGVTIQSRAALPGEIEDDGFVFTLHIDNRRCTALIDAPSIGAESAGDECGFIRYTPADPSGVQVGYHALHEGNFAFFDFSIRRGHRLVSFINDGEVAAATVASSAPDGSAHSYSGDGTGNFSHNFPKGDLLGPCSEAGFAETLYVYAKATNGWERINSYDASDSRGFALAPKVSA